MTGMCQRQKCIIYTVSIGTMKYECRVAHMYARLLFAGGRGLALLVLFKDVIITKGRSEPGAQ
jgi:hypothetical protein